MQGHYPPQYKLYRQTPTFSDKGSQNYRVDRQREKAVQGHSSPTTILTKTINSSVFLFGPVYLSTTGTYERRTHTSRYKTLLISLTLRTCLPLSNSPSSPSPNRLPLCCVSLLLYLFLLLASVCLTLKHGIIFLSVFSKVALVCLVLKFILLASYSS